MHLRTRSGTQCAMSGRCIRLAANFVVDATLERGARVVTFANGLVVCELNVGVNDARRRLPCASVGL